MSKHRLRVCIGYKDDDSPIIKQICATSEFELADLAARALLKSARRNEFVADVPVQKAIPLFGKYATEWLKTYKKGKLKPTTLKGYVSILNTHFYPAWRQTPIDQSHDHQFNWWFGDAPERGGLLAPPKGGVESTILAASQGGYFSVLLSL